jgi:hypothetical protein
MIHLYKLALPKHEAMWQGFLGYAASTNYGRHLPVDRYFHYDVNSFSEADVV